MKELDFSRLEVIDEKCNTEISALLKLSLGDKLFDVNKYILSDGVNTLQYTGILILPSSGSVKIHLIVPDLDRSVQPDEMIADLIQDWIGFSVNPRIEELTIG